MGLSVWVFELESRVGVEELEVKELGDGFWLLKSEV